jgi:hypothetical protein
MLSDFDEMEFQRDGDGVRAGDLLDRVIAELARLQTENATLRKELRNGG